MPRRINWQPSGGISRIRGVEEVSFTRPYNLQNVRVEARDVAVALREGAEGPLIGGCKPWFKVNSNYIHCSNCVNAGDYHNGLLYTAGCGSNCLIDGCGSLQVYPPSFVPGSDVDGERPENQPPRITSSQTVATPGTAPDDEGVPDNHFVTYLLIPLNDRGEAGEWHYVHFANDSGVRKNPTLSFTATESTYQVLIYRTAQLGIDTGQPNPQLGLSKPCGPRQFYQIESLSNSQCSVLVGGCQSFVIDHFEFAPAFDGTCTHTNDPGNTFNIYLQGAPDLTAFSGSTFDLYFTKSFGPTAAPGTPYNIISGTAGGVLTMTDSFNYYNDLVQFFYNLGGSCDTIFEEFGEVLICDRATPPGSSEVGYQVVDKNCIDINISEQFQTATVSVPDTPAVGETTTTQSITENPCFPSQPTLNRSRNVHTFVSDAYKGFCAKAMLNDAGTMMYGNVTWPTKEVIVGYINQGNTTGRDIRVQYEYEVEGAKLYGPVTEYTDVDHLIVEIGGAETAVLIYAEDGGSVFRLVERVVTNEVGRYISSCDTCFTFDHDESPIPTAEAVTQYAPTDCINEKSVVFFAESQRPLEVTYQQFSLPKDEEVRVLSPARLAEEEDIRSYNFYIATDKNIYVASRSGDAATYEQIGSGFGVNTGFDQQPLWTPVRYGVVFYGTDDHLYYLTGRQVTPLDLEVNENSDREALLDLWNFVYDIAYHVRFGEVWVSTDTGIWVTGLDRRDGWIAQYNLQDPGGRKRRLFYDESLSSNGELGHMIVGDSVDQTTGETTIMDNSGQYLVDPSITTQFLQDDPRRTIWGRGEPIFEHMPTDRLPNGSGINRMTVTESVKPPSTDTNLTHVYSRSFLVDPYTPFYPRLSGHGHQFTFTEFSELSYVEFLSDRRGGNN